MAEGQRMTAAQLADKLLTSEHVDLLRDSVAWLVAQLMKAEVIGLTGAELGERAPGWTSSSPRTRRSGAPCRTGHQASSGSIWTKTRSPKFQRWRPCPLGVDTKRPATWFPGRYNSLSPQGLPCGRPPAALRPGNDKMVTGGTGLTTR
jgi:hypothetical protein